MPDQFLDSMQEFLDLWVEHNNLSEVENEAVYRLDAEGEFFVRKFFGNDGMLRTRFIEPELIRSPVDSSDSPQDTFGIRTSPEDIRDVVYDTVAQNRYNLMGKRDECRCSDPQFADRFLLD